MYMVGKYVFHPFILFSRFLTAFGEKAAHEKGGATPPQRSIILNIFIYKNKITTSQQPVVKIPHNSG